MDRASRNARGRAGWVMVLTVLLLVGVVTFAVTANSWKHEFRVIRFRTVGNSLLADSDIVMMAAIPKSVKLFDVDLNAARLRVQQSPFIRNVSVVREIPDGILIAVTERKPVAALVLDRIFYLDAEGYVLPSVRSGVVLDLPVLTGESQAAHCVPGERIKSQRVREALEILITAGRIGDDLYHLISEVHCAGDSTLILFTAESGIPVVVGRGDIAMKLVKFDGFWKQIVNQRGATRLKTVDLRFADQIVARWDEEHGALAQ